MKSLFAHKVLRDLILEESKNYSIGPKRITLLNKHLRENQDNKLAVDIMHFLNKLERNRKHNSYRLPPQIFVDALGEITNLRKDSQKALLAKVVKEAIFRLDKMMNEGVKTNQYAHVLTRVSANTVQVGICRSAELANKLIDLGYVKVNPTNPIVDLIIDSLPSNILGLSRLATISNSTGLDREVKLFHS